MSNMIMRSRGVRLRLGSSGRAALRLGVALPAAAAIALAPTTGALAFITNTATATGSAPDGTTESGTDTANVPVEPATPQIGVDKTFVITDDAGNIKAEATAGDTITYTYTVTNTSNVTLTDIVLVDNHDGTGADPVPTLVADPLTDNGATGDSFDTNDPGGPYDQLGVGDQLTYTGTYVVTQADIDAAGGAAVTPGNTANDDDLDSLAVGTGIYLRDPADTTDDVTVTDSAPAEVPLTINRGIAIDKIALDAAGNRIDTGATPPASVSAGDTITYQYTVQNTGNTNLNDVTVAETAFNGTGTAPVPLLVDASVPATSTDDSADEDVDILAPGDTVTFEATYTVTQSDIDQLQ